MAIKETELHVSFCFLYNVEVVGFRFSSESPAPGMTTCKAVQHVSTYFDYIKSPLGLVVETGYILKLIFFCSA